MSDLAKDFCRLFCEQTYTAIVGFDRQCQIIALNRAAETTFGIKSKDMSGQGIEAILPEEHRQTLGQICQTKLSQNVHNRINMVKISELEMLQFLSRIPIFHSTEQTPLHTCGTVHPLAAL